MSASAFATVSSAGATAAADVVASNARLEATWAALPDDAWSGEGVSVMGRVPLDDLPFRRWRETEVHQQVWMIDGVMEVSVGDAHWRLAAGDCLAMRLDRPIVYRNPTQSEARYLVALARAQLAEVGRGLAGDLHHHVEGGAGQPGAAAGEQLVHHHAEGEDVGAAVDLAAARLLGRHVRGCPHPIPGVRERLTVPAEVRDPEVGDLQSRQISARG